MTKDRKKTGGRETGTANKLTLTAREILDQYVDFNIVASKLFELVMGIWVEEVSADGRKFVYQKPPDALAAKYLWEMRFGKPKEFIDMRVLTLIKAEHIASLDPEKRKLLAHGTPEERMKIADEILKGEK